MKTLDDSVLAAFALKWWSYLTTGGALHDMVDEILPDEEIWLRGDNDEVVYDIYLQVEDFLRRVKSGKVK